MGNMRAYQPPKKYKNYSLPTSKPLSSHAFYKEKVWTLQEQIYNKLKKIAESLARLYPKLTNDMSKHIKAVIEKNLKILIKDLDLIQHSMQKNPDSFNTTKLKINQQHITEMKNICDTLQSVRSYEYEFKHLGKIKHALHELEHLIQPTRFEKNLEKGVVKSKPKTAPAKKTRPLAGSKEKIKAAPAIKSKKQNTISKKTKPVAKVPKKQIKAKSKKSAPSLNTLKPSAKKITKTKPKLPAKNIH